MPRRLRSLVSRVIAYAPALLVAVVGFLPMAAWGQPRTQLQIDGAAQATQPRTTQGLFATMKGHITNSGILPGTETNAEKVIGGIITGMISLLGVIFFILIIYGGYLWMTARGNEQQIEKAKAIIKSSSIGLAVVLTAYLITFIVLEILAPTTLQPPPAAGP